MPAIVFSSSALVQTFGRLHVAVVHFPIGLLLLAGLIEAWRMVRRKPGLSPTSVTCVVLGAVAAVAAAGMGWVLASGEAPDETLTWHRWMGVATACISIVIAGMTLAVARAGAKHTAAGRPVVLPFRNSLGFGIMVCAAMVGVTGHFGGDITHGQGYLTELLTKPVIEQAKSAVASAREAAGPVVQLVSAKSGKPAVKNEDAPPISAVIPTVPTTGEKVDFEKQIKPILEATCYDCHGPDKARGNLRVDSGTAMLKGGKGGPSVLPHDAEHSPMLRRVLGLDKKKRMPQGDDPLPAVQIALIRAWIEQGAPMGKEEVKVSAGPTTQKYVPPLEPRKVELPPAAAEATNPIDRILASYFKSHPVKQSAPVPDRVYARRVYLDVVGMIPTEDELAAFEAESSADKRAQLVDHLLADKRRYAENYLTFWNDALRNDYKGPGYIDGGRKQITGWLYQALLDNMPYDRFVSELVNPKPESEGFAKGIIWRGAVSASQVPQLQAAQNISQVFLGINMKCASCHDSFISDWKLADAYGLASVYSDKPMPLFRCEKATGETATIKFLYPQLGSIDASAPRVERLAQLAKIITSKQDGRLTRTIVNRFWARFMGRGLVEPLDEMDNEPWNADLLDYLAMDLAENSYDLKHMIRTILTSNAYQMPAMGMGDPNEKEYVFAGPVVRRLSAEEFCDAVSQLTGVWQAAPAARPPGEEVIAGRWVWSTSGALKDAAAGTIYVRKEFTLDAMPAKAVIAGTCDNALVIYVNGKKAGASKEWGKPAGKDVTKLLTAGKNLIAIQATNDPGTAGSNPAALWALLSMSVKGADGKTSVSEIGTDATWVWSEKKTAGWEKPQTVLAEPWKPVADLGASNEGVYNLAGSLAAANVTYTLKGGKFRAVWANNDRLMTALGRPNREQTVTYRSTAATTLQALELTNGPELSGLLEQGAEHWLSMESPSIQGRIERLYVAALGRKPTAAEAAVAGRMASDGDKASGMQDLIWTILMLPEFQLIY